jgi:hypothetical protein
MPEVVVRLIAPGGRIEYPEGPRWRRLQDALIEAHLGLDAPVRQNANYERQLRRLTAQASEVYEVLGVVRTLPHVRPDEVEYLLEMPVLCEPVVRDHEADHSSYVLRRSYHADNAALLLERLVERLSRRSLIKGHHAALGVHDVQELQNGALIGTRRQANAQSWAGGGSDDSVSMCSFLLSITHLSRAS